jgi:hypothetical protein
MVLDEYSIIFNIIYRKKALHSLICVKTNRLICFSNWKQTIGSLQENNTHAWYNMNLSQKIPKEINLNLSFDYVYDSISQNFVKKEIEDSELMPYLIISEKSSAFDFLNRNICKMRYGSISQLPHQTEIYKKKYNEAVAFIDSDFSVSRYLKSYSDIKGIDMRQAAKLIIEKHELYNAVLENSEHIRLKYTELIRNSNSLEELNLVYDNMNKEINVYGKF